MMEDHAELVDRLQRALAAAWLERPELLNVPGASMACKVDPNYYLALYPAFIDFLSRSAGMYHDKVREALVRTGNLPVNQENGAFSLVLRLIWEQGGALRHNRLESCFLHNSFIDRALMLYARQAREFPISSLAISVVDKQKSQDFLNGRTQLEAMAFKE